MQVRDSKVKFLKDEELGTVVHVHKPQKAQQQQQQQVGDQGYCFCWWPARDSLLPICAGKSQDSTRPACSSLLGLGSATAHRSQCKAVCSWVMQGLPAQPISQGRASLVPKGCPQRCL